MDMLTLQSGTMIHVNGIPAILVNDTVVESTSSHLMNEIDTPEFLTEAPTTEIDGH